MKFDMIIMNPPYGNKHKKILKKCVEMKADKIISIQPIRWLQEDYNGTKSKFLPENTEIIDHGLDLWEGFNAGAPVELGIFHISKNSKNNLDSIRHKTRKWFGSSKNLNIQKLSNQKILSL